MHDNVMNLIVILFIAYLILLVIKMLPIYFELIENNSDDFFNFIWNNYAVQVREMVLDDFYYPSPSSINIKQNILMHNLMCI